MSLKHRVLSAAYMPLKLYNLTTKRARLRVLLYHDIAIGDQTRFEKQIDWLSQYWNFISPSEFDDLMCGSLPLLQDSLLLTFDDGFFSNRMVVENTLNPRGIKSLFFIVSDFFDLIDISSARDFIANNIYPDSDRDALPIHWKNMGYRDLEYLIEHGHVIGAHTATHARLSTLPDAELQSEIVNSADKLEQCLGISVEHFAYTFGDIESFSPAALTVARDRFKYVFTGLRGNNSPDTPHWAIRRDSIQPDDTLMLTGALLQGAADILYRKSLHQYQNWGET